MATLPGGGALFPNPQQGQQNSVFTDNGSFQLIMQQDGNLVLYKTANLAATAIWAFPDEWSGGRPGDLYSRSKTHLGLPHAGAIKLRVCQDFH